MGDDVIDCVCGDNEEYGFMVACETCGAWEHGECCRIYSEAEIPKDYKCSACVRSSSKCIALIDFAPEDKPSPASLRTAPTPVRSPEGDEIEDETFGTIDGVAAALERERTVVCCVCGCEDCADDYGAMIRACTCANGGAIAHASCMKNWSDKYAQAPSKTSGGRSRTPSRSAGLDVKCKACGDAGGKASGLADGANVDEMLKVFSKVIEDTAAKYEAAALAYRSNPRPRPRALPPATATPVAEVKSKKEKVNTAQKEEKSEEVKKAKTNGVSNKTKVKTTPTTNTPKVKPTVVPIPVKHTPAPKPAPVSVSARTDTTPATAINASVKKTTIETPLSMLPLKKRRLMAWDSEQKLQATATIDTPLSENVKRED
jgi:hypothetical protein